MVQRKRIWLGTMRLRVQSLASGSGLRIWHCHKLWCRSQTWLRSGVAVAVVEASSYSSNPTPSPGTSTCCDYGHKKKHKRTNKKTRMQLKWMKSTKMMLHQSLPHFLCLLEEFALLQLNKYSGATSFSTQAAWSWSNGSQCNLSRWATAVHLLNVGSVQNYKHQLS